MTTVLLIVHGLIAVGLLGAVTHQAIAAWAPARRPTASFVGRARSVAATSYSDAIVVLYLCTGLLGGIIYPAYRLEIRTVVEQLGMWPAFGAFELKEHFWAVGLGTLPAYWIFWRQPLSAEYARARAVLTAMLAFIVWWNFLTGHVLNNIRGFGS
jgi:hypothetical protein